MRNAGFCRAGFIALSAMVVISMPVFADCGSEYEAAKLSILDLKKQALDGKKLDSTAFTTVFQQKLTRMQQQACQQEMLQLVQFIQQEQQMVPVSMPSSNK